MPAPLPTNLLETQPANPAAYYLKGAEFGLEQETAQARLAEFAQRTQLEQQQLGMEQQKLGMMAEENKMKHLEAQQSLAIEKSYRDMQLAAQKRQLDMAGQLMQQRTQAAARQGAAMMEWDQFNKILDATPGMDDAAKDSARRSKLFQLAPSMSEGHMAGLSQMLKPQATIPEPMEKTLPSGEKIFWTGKSWSAEKASTADSGKFLDTGEATRLRSEISSISKGIRENQYKKGKILDNAIAEMNENKKKLNALDRRYGHPIEHPEVDGQSSPDATGKPTFKVLKIRALESQEYPVNATLPGDQYESDQDERIGWKNPQ